MAITTHNNNVCLQTVVDMFGIDPLKFNGIYPSCIEYNDNGCEDFWTQYFENGNITSREELAGELSRAEIEIASYLEQFPFTTYICDEGVEFDYCYSNRNVLGVNLTDYTFTTDWKCIQDFGVFEDEILGTGTVTLIDQDGDGYKEMAEIVFDYSAVTTEFSAEELTLLFQNYDNYNNTICPILSINDDTIAETITFAVNSWNLVNPELYLARKFVAYTALDACDDEIYVTEVDVCAKVKTCKPDGWIYYDGLDGCSGPDCEETAIPFCARLVDSQFGFFKITPGTVDEEGCFVETHGTCFPCAKPKRIEINYVTGCSGCYKTKKDLSLCNLIERAIIYLAVTRLPRTLCDCGCSTEFLEELKQDTSITYRDTTVRFNYPNKLRNLSPFGTKIGELEAYKIVSQLVDKLC